MVNNKDIEKFECIVIDKEIAIMKTWLKDVINFTKKYKENNSGAKISMKRIENSIREAERLSVKRKKIAQSSNIQEVIKKRKKDVQVLKQKKRRRNTNSSHTKLRNLSLDKEALVPEEMKEKLQSLQEIEKTILEDEDNDEDNDEDEEPEIVRDDSDNSDEMSNPDDQENDMEL